MQISPMLRCGLLLVAVAMLVSRSAGLSAAVNDYAIAQAPLFMGDNQPPLMMMVMSRDEQLFNKAYSDYTDLDGDAVLDTTYQDKFDYSGYFDPNLCYSYTSARFKAVAAAVGDNRHTCSGQWSGNFLNWVSMSRLDILRFVLYGGQRSTDAETTVLERAPIPNDLHAWSKVYSGTDISNFTPLTGVQSFCNATIANGGAPLMRVASGNWSEWAATASYQCGRARTGDGSADTPGATTDYNVRVEVCDPSAPATKRENFCQKYSNGVTDSWKPVGLLQTYGENGRLRFGMVSGSYGAPRSGGVLRRNIGKLAGNGIGNCASGDEVNMSNGRFCTGTTEGIINTLSGFKLTQWNYANNWNDCNTWGLLNRQGFGSAGNGNITNPGTGGQACSAWGNPLAEMYSEALRYIVAGGATATTGFAGGTELAGLPTGVQWKDPYRSPKEGGNSYCAKCSILVMSSGLPSFDSDELPTVSRVGSAETATNALGANEGLNGNYMVGRMVTSQAQLNVGKSVNTHEDICTAKTVAGKLANVRGVCPDAPSMEGSYLMSGLAFKANTTDLRPGLQGKPSSYTNTVQTYAVELAENLPKFDIPVGGGKITLSPLCQSNKSGTATNTGNAADVNWRACFLGSVGIGTKTSSIAPNYVYGRPLLADGSAGSFSLVWEDSLWGNDHDNDVVSMLSYCVGASCGQPSTTARGNICWRSNSAACSGTVASDEVLVRIENLSAYAGNAMLTGFVVSGSNSDGTKRLALRPGNSNGSVLTTTADAPSNWTKPQVLKLRRGTSDAKLLESPLWYAAKYGSFDDRNKNGLPDSGEWDRNKAGTPDSYFLARDPSKLKAELDRIFNEVVGNASSTGGAASGARINTDSFAINVSYKLKPDSNDWTGDVSGIAINSDGSSGSTLWNAANKLSGSRSIYVTTVPTTHTGTGSVARAVSAKEFTATNLVGGTSADKLATLGLPTTTPVWFSSYTAADMVAYLKGATSAEKRNGGKLRDRGSLLGDIINSTPEIVSPRDDYGYGYWASAGAGTWKGMLGSSYKTYLTTKRTRSPTIYVGANDGMLHGFDGSASTAGGGEHFAFIPAGARDHLADLANPEYVHRYYVDGGMTSSDVPFSATGDWRTVLVGATGAGGRSVFGLDISTPASFSASNVLWELSGDNQNDLGHVMGKPKIVPVNSAGGPRWVALFGNGANSNTGAPVLFAVDVKTGEIIARLKPSGAGYASRNGLMGITPVAVANRDGLVDTVYGGDLQGNVWKFDLSDANPGSWSVAFGGAPLFTAELGGNAQPITGGLQASRGPGGGILVFFGTGRYFVQGDNLAVSGSPVQSLYGILDNLSVPVSGRNALVEQQLTTGTSGGGYSIRNVSRNPVNYASKRGWYMDLAPDGNAMGERFIGTPTLQSGKVVFTTYESADATCTSGGLNWMYVLDILSGGAALSGISTDQAGKTTICQGVECGGVLLNKDGQTSAPIKDSVVSIPQSALGTPGDLDSMIAAEKCSFVIRTSGGAPLYLPRPCGRQSWRQVR